MHEHAPRRRAALARGADRAENERRDREVEIGGRIDDDRVVAAELQQALAEPLRDAHADLAADMRRAGKRDEGNAFVGDEAGRELRTAIDEQLKNWRQRVAQEHAIA